MRIAAEIKPTLNNYSGGSNMKYLSNDWFLLKKLTELYVNVLAAVG
jgi:hypothetical protein